MEKLFRKLREYLEQGKGAVLVTVIASSGSTPRGAGSRMLVTEDGIVCGTIGGGAVEYRAFQKATEALKNRTSCIKGYTLTRDQVADIGMVCGGNVTVCFQYADPENGGLRDLARRAEEAFRKDEDSWLVLDITDETCWKMDICTEKERREGTGTFSELIRKKGPDAFCGKALQAEAENRRYYIEPLVQAGTVYVFGGGHVAQKLVPLLSQVGFSCVVMDDREEFSNPEVFPDAKETVVGDMNRIGDYLHITSRDYVCIMTRGHQFDYYVQRQALSAKPKYIGVMGSRNKIRVVTEKLLEDGFALEEIESCHMPIGTRILAETPAEIAVSIAGELIQVRAESRKQAG